MPKAAAGAGIAACAAIIVVAAGLAAQAQGPGDRLQGGSIVSTADVVRDIAPTGKLRVAFVSVPIYATKDAATGELKGVAIDLGKELAHQIGATVVIRGLRAVSDFEYEFQMAAMNQRMDKEIETVFLMADPRNQAIASRLVKEIAMYGGDISQFVTPYVAERLVKRCKELGAKS